MNPLSFSKYKNMKDRANQRAREMVEELRSMVAANPNSPEGYEPEKLQDALEDIYYESEKLAEQYRNDDKR